MGLSVLFLGGCGIPEALTDQSNSGKQVIAEVSTSPANDSVKMTLKDLLAKGKNQKCSWTFQDNSQTITGIIYVSGNKFKQEMAVVDPSTKKATVMDTISDGANMYIWNSETNSKGIKMKITEDKAPATGSVDWNKQYQYQCSTWTVSEGELTVPTKVQFSDVSQLQEMQNKFEGKFPTDEAGKSAGTVK